MNIIDDPQEGRVADAAEDSARGRLGSGQIQHNIPFHQKRVQLGEQDHDRGLICHQGGRRRWRVGEGPDLGHRRAGAIPIHGECLLQGGGGGPAGLRHHQGFFLLESLEVAEGAQKLRQRGHGLPDGGQQERPQAVPIAEM